MGRRDSLSLVVAAAVASTLLAVSLLSAQEVHPKPGDGPDSSKARVIARETDSPKAERGDAKPSRDAAERRKLRRAIDAILSDKSVKKAKVSAHVRDLGSGETLYAKHADLPLNPASNMKVITAAAVLDHFGPSYTSHTDLVGPSAKGGTLTGNLVLRGNGDPFLMWGHLVEMAARARRKGLKRVTDDLVVDDSAFDGEFLPPQYDQKHEDASYRATISAVAAEFSAVTVVIRPGEVGKKPHVTFEPPGDYAVVDNKATTVKTKKEASKNVLKCESTADGVGTKFIISGKTWPGGGATVRKRIHNPSLYTGHLMKAALAMVGVKVEGKVRRGKGKGGTVYARHNSYSLPYNIAAMEKWSNNFMAEMLFKSLALGDKPATYALAQKRVGEFLTRAKVPAADYHITNGSGLYDANTVSAEAFTQLLAYMQTRRGVLPEFESGFAIAGVDGTLHRRMKKTPAEGVLRGKTGTLNRVITLTGYVQTRSGRKVGYSILFNKNVGGAWGYRNAQNEIGALLADLD